MESRLTTNHRAADAFSGGDYKTAELLLLEELQHQRAQAPIDWLAVCERLNLLGLVYYYTDRLELSVATFRQAIQAGCNLFPETSEPWLASIKRDFHSVLYRSMHNAACRMAQLGCTVEAAITKRRAEIIEARLTLDESPAYSCHTNASVASATCKLAEMLHEEGLSHTAENLFQEAIKIRQWHLGSYHKKLAPYYRRYAVFLESMRRQTEAESLLHEASFCVAPDKSEDT